MAEDDESRFVEAERRESYANSVQFSLNHCGGSRWVWSKAGLSSQSGCSNNGTGLGTGFLRQCHLNREGTQFGYRVP